MLTLVVIFPDLLLSKTTVRISRHSFSQFVENPTTIAAVAAPSEYTWALILWFDPANTASFKFVEWLVSTWLT